MNVPIRIELFLRKTYVMRLCLRNKKTVLDWYRQLAQYYLNLGIPVDGVLGLLKKHPVSIAWVSRYANMHKPEMVARNILIHRHDPVEYDPLAKPRIRVTKKKISEFRSDLEREMRRIWHPGDVSLEYYIKEYCYQPEDEEIADYIRRGTEASVWADNIYNYL